MFKRLLVVVCLLCLAPAMALTAQDDDDTCPTVVDTAIEAADSACSDIGRNQACYGNVLVNAESSEGVSEFTFESIGDIVDLTDISSLALSEFNPETEDWGVAILRLQANISAPGQNVTFVLFGDVEIEDAAAEDQNPMQAFVLRGGIGQPACEQAPNGVLVQTPEGVAEVEMTMNGVDVVLGSTAFLALGESDDETPVLNFTLWEGSATITVGDVSITLDPGTFSTIPLDEDFVASGAPSEPQPLDGSAELLPVTLLPEDIMMAGDDAMAAGGFAGTPASGPWTFSLGEVGGEGCPAELTQGFAMLGDIGGNFDAAWTEGFTPDSVGSSVSSVQFTPSPFSELLNGFLAVGEASEMPPGTTVTTEQGYFRIDTAEGVSIEYILESETRFVANLTGDIPGMCTFTLQMIFEYAG